MKIFVLHYSKLIERKEHILKQFEKHNIKEYEFIETFDKDELTNEYRFTPNYKKSTMSLFLKHIFVYKEISEKYNEALILEDDVILGDDFMNKLSIYMSQLPSDYDMLFVGEGLVNMHVPSNQLKPGVNIYETSADPTCWGYGGSSKCSDSYIVSKKCATTLINYVWREKTSLPVDHWINLAVKENNLKVFWAEPTIAQQGTQIGMFKSSIEPTDVTIHSYPKIEPIIQNRFLM